MKIISENRIIRSAIDFACINVFSNAFGADVTRAFRHLFLPPAVLAQKKLSELHQIVVGLSEKDLKAELTVLKDIIDEQAFDGKTALSWAARRGDLEAVNLLLSHGADPNIYDLRGNGPLHSAACSTNWRCIPALLEHGANARQNNSRNESPVNYALFYADDPHYLQPLLDAGADVNGRDYHGDTPLITATYRAPASPPVPAFGAVNCVDYLIQRGANTEFATAEGNTPLLNATSHGNCGAVLTLLQAGADHCVRNSAGDTMLHLVARHGDLALLKILMNMAAKLQNLDIEAINHEGYTPKEAVGLRVKYVEGFAEHFEELLIKIAMEEGLDSMVASTIITIGSYDDAVEYQDEEKAFAEHEERMGEYADEKLSLPCDFITC
jgi:ankyrin repeat protein